MVNYMQDRPQSRVKSELDGWLGTPQACANYEKWVLVDGAVLGELILSGLLKDVRPKGVFNVLAGTEFSSYGKLAPHLIRLSCAYSATEFLGCVLERSSGYPSVAVLDACSDVVHLVDTLRWLARARTEDGVELYCRFADTRVTPALMEVIHAHQRSRLANSIDGWQIIDRHGAICPLNENLNSISFSPRHSGPTESGLENLILSEQQFSSMMASCEADEIFHLFCEGATDLVPEGGLGLFHARLTKLVTAARRLGLEATGEIFQFCVIALTTQESFYLNPILVGSWQKVRHKAISFSALVADWTDETWDSLSRGHHYPLEHTLESEL
jgi:hypothetical protein